jgi:hypothetical protein
MNDLNMLRRLAESAWYYPARLPDDLSRSDRKASDDILLLIREIESLRAANRELLDWQVKATEDSLELQAKVHRLEYKIGP